MTQETTLASSQEIARPQELINLPLQAGQILRCSRVVVGAIS